ncbi:MAG: hypothetical protein JW862_16200 [Anaerolineales bacterium]|nr:hypothetical protein [Anaerolineales bacterium]
MNTDHRPPSAGHLPLRSDLKAVQLLSGFWLSRSDRPYSMLISALHKLAGVGTGIYFGLTVYRADCLEYRDIFRKKQKPGACLSG